MIQLNKQSRNRQRKRDKVNFNVAQLTINAVLWTIIKQNVDEPDSDAVLTIPNSELKDVPVLFSLHVNYDKDGNILIKASVKEEKKIVLLSDRQ